MSLDFYDYIFSVPVLIVPVVSTLLLVILNSLFYVISI